jgi:NADPH2:quinone reductase
VKAIRISEFGGPDVLRLEEVPDPKPGKGQIVVAVKAVGVNPVDAYIRSGNYGRNRPVPYTPGSDAVGVVEAVGEGVTKFRAGDRVYTSYTVTGAYAEKALAEASSVFSLPDNISFSAGAGINVPYATAYYALFQRAQAQPGETVLVHGASGGVGLGAVEIARARGFKVFGTASTEAGRAAVRDAGAHQIFNHREDGYLEKARAATPDGKGFDVILEMLANVNLGKDLTVLAPAGRVVIIGSRGPATIDPRETMSRDAAILGMSLFNATPAELKSIHSALYAGLANGTLHPLVGKELPLVDAATAHTEIMDEGGHVPGKIVLTP